MFPVIRTRRLHKPLRVALLVKLHHTLHIYTGIYIFGHSGGDLAGVNEDAALGDYMAKADRGALKLAFGRLGIELVVSLSLSRTMRTCTRYS